MQGLKATTRPCPLSPFVGALLEFPYLRDNAEVVSLFIPRGTERTDHIAFPLQIASVLDNAVLQHVRQLQSDPEWKLQNPFSLAPRYGSPTNEADYKSWLSPITGVAA